MTARPAATESEVQLRAISTEKHTRTNPEHA